jgi:hypothetical protein
MPAAPDVLEAAAAVLAADPGADAQRLAASLRAYVSGVDRSQVREQRNAALRVAALRYSGLTPGARARLLALALQRYFAGAWRVDRGMPACPYQSGTFQSCLWCALRASPRALSSKQISRILDIGGLDVR